MQSEVITEMHREGAKKEEKTIKLNPHSLNVLCFANIHVRPAAQKLSMPYRNKFDSGKGKQIRKKQGLLTNIQNCPTANL